MSKLDGKVAIVTGAARGLGRAYAKRLAGLGAKIAVADINLRSFEEFEAEAKDMTADSTVAEIEAMGGSAIGIEVDVTDNEAVEAMVARVVQEWSRVDVLVANAGGGRGRPIDTKASTLDPALLRLVVDMNLFGTVYAVNAVAPIMKEERHGKIITVSSVAGTAPSADGGYAHYGAAKAAIAHYTRYLAQDLGPFGITANCIAPGVICDRPYHADGDSRKRAEQSRSGRVGRAAAAWDGRGLRQGGRVPGDRSVRLCDRGCDPDRWRVS
jgi:3-oxoacyl-[acyl-carrier protein] reductase